MLLFQLLWDRNNSFSFIIFTSIFFLTTFNFVVINHKLLIYKICDTICTYNNLVTLPDFATESNEKFCNKRQGLKLNMICVFYHLEF